MEPEKQNTVSQQSPTTNPSSLNTSTVESSFSPLSSEPEIPNLVSNTVKSKRWVFLVFAAVFALVITLALGYFIYAKYGVQNPASSPTPANLSTGVPSSTLVPTMVPITTSTPKVTPETNDYDYTPTNSLTCGHTNPLDHPWFPARGPAPLIVYFWGLAGRTINDDDYIAGYQWDFEGDGKWDTEVLTTDGFTHVYTKNGDFQPKYRIKGTKNTWSKICDYLHPVVIGESVDWKNNVLSVTKTNVDVTMSRSEKNYDLVVNEYGDPNTYFNYGTGFFISILSEKSSIKLNRYGANIDHGFIVSMGSSYAGTGYFVHTYIDPKLANGTYSGTYTLEYWTNENGYWKQATDISYTIQLTD